MLKWLGGVLERRGLAIACVLAPLVLGVLGNGFLANWLNAGSELCAITRELSFSLIGETSPSPLKLSPEEQKICNAANAARLAEAAPMPPPVLQPDPATPPAAVAPALKTAGSNADTAKKETGTDKPLPPRLQLVANHVAGRLNVAYAYAFLILVSVVAFLFGSYVVVEKAGWVIWLGITVVFLVVTAGLGYSDIRGGGVRHFVADNILMRADAHALLQFLPAEANLRSLIWLGLTVGYLSVGLVLAALYLASIRRGTKATLDDLKERLVIIRVGLVLGSAILVVVVLSSRAVYDWPLSLLVETDRKALAPAADALVRKWGAIGSISLIAAFLPAITAWYLDRDAYRNTPQPAKKTAKPSPDAGELEIAPMSTVTSILAILAPVIASPIFDGLKSLVAAVSK
jgi:hypothetical protein